MPKDNSASQVNLTPVYIAMALLGGWVMYISQEHSKLAYQVSDKNLCSLNATCKAAAASSTNTPLTTNSAGKFSSPPKIHNSFADCLNYQSVVGNPNGVASFIQNEIQARGNLPLAVQDNQCAGGGCPHTPEQCYTFWTQYAQSLSQ